MRLFVLLTVILLCLSGCSRKCFMLFNYRCEKISNAPLSEVKPKATPLQQESPLISAPAPIPTTTAIAPTIAATTTNVPTSPCGLEEICEFNIDLYSQWLAQKINTTLIDKDYLEQNITISPKCEELGCLPPPFHNTFEGMLQDNLLSYGVGVREVEDENSLMLRYQAQVVPTVGKYKSNMSQLVLTTTIIKADRFIFSNTARFTINKWDAWQYRVTSPASVIPITQSSPRQMNQQPATVKASQTVLEPQPLTTNNS